MNIDYIILTFAVSAGFYMAWNIGANDVANSMGTSVGSGSLSLKKAIIIASIANFLGAVLVGGHVTNTIRKGMIDPGMFVDNPYLLVYGMFAALIASGVWLNIATLYGLPVSTTHSIIGAVLGFGLIAGGPESIQWAKVMKVVASWVISPVTGGVISFTMFFYLRKTVLNTHHPIRAVKKVAPYLLTYIAFILTLSLIYKGLKNLHLNFSLIQSLGIAIIVSICTFFITKQVVKSINEDEFADGDHKSRLMRTENIFGVIQVITATYMAFAHGANDVANSIGPLAAIVSILKHKAVLMTVDVPFWTLCVGGIGIAAGIYMLGYKVIETIGKNITEVTPSRGFSAEFGAATTVLICSRLGLPISSTHTLIGSVIGVGLARGISALNFKVIKNIVYSWIITLPATGLITILIYKLLIAFLM